MKNTFSGIMLVFVCAAVSLSVSAADKKFTTEKQKFSYALGVQMGNSLRQQGLNDVDAEALGQAIADVLSGSDFKVSVEDMQAAVQSFTQQQQAKAAEAAQAATAAGHKYRAENKKKKGVKELPNGIQYEVLKAGKGKKPQVTDTVTVHYHGTLISGKVFDSSVQRGQPATFPINGVIKGWQEVVPMMPTGSKWRVVIPPELAYGEQGAGGAIGANETLIFEIELLSIKE